MPQSGGFSETSKMAPGDCSAVVGLQWGDEGKGKAVDLLAPRHDAVVRYNGGANAGHSVVVNGQRFSLHLIPSGILYPGKHAVVGNGVVVDPWKLTEEVDGLAAKGIDTSGLRISTHAHVVMPYHKMEDGLREDLLTKGSSGGGAIGTTRRGIGPAYAEKVQRAAAIRMGDLLEPAVVADRVRVALELKASMIREWGAGKQQAELDAMGAKALTDAAAAIGRRLAPMMCDTTRLQHDLLGRGGNILFESANGTLLDVDHGTYPFVTGSSCVVAGVGTGAGVPPTRLKRVLGIMKAYSTRVGAGPLPTELKDATGDRIRERGREYGTTTGRPRRVGWLDLVAVKYSAMINGATGICVTLLDVLAGFENLQVCTSYDVGGERTSHFPADARVLAGAKPVFETLEGFGQEISGARTLAELPTPARKYIDFVAEFVGVPIDIVSVGPGREQTIFC
jgi:adenylosuccinate synthase